MPSWLNPEFLLFRLFFYTIRMRTNRIIFVNGEDSGVSREPGVRFPACATPDNITNSPLYCCGRINLENIKNSETSRVDWELCPLDSALFIDEPAKNRYYRLTKRMWRNWQTRRLQEPVGSTPWRFDSSHPHYLTIIPAGSSH